MPLLKVTLLFAVASVAMHLIGILIIISTHAYTVFFRSKISSRWCIRFIITYFTVAGILWLAAIILALISVATFVISM